MAKNVNSFGVARTVLAAAVANSGTFTVGYPTGTTQGSFTGGLAGSAHIMVINDNDDYVAPSQFSAAFGASNITVTNSTGQTLPAGADVAIQFDMVDGNQVAFLTFPIELASIVGTQDVVTDFQPGFDGTIEDIEFVVNKAVTTAAKLASLNVEIGTTDLTGGIVALTSAAATPMGKIIAASAITGNNVLTRTSKISVEASAVTAFAEGSGTLIIRCRKTPSSAY